MFTDLVGSTRLRTTTGDDAVDLRLDAHRSAVDAICAEHGGTVVKDTGDGCLVAFTSARSAIAAALALQAEPAGLGDSFRIGIHAGDVRDDGDVRGEAVNAASRITSLAEGGQILVSQVVRELVGTIGVDVVEHGSFELRGFPRPWTLFRVEAATRGRWRLALLGDGLVERDRVVVESLSTARIMRLLGRVAVAPARRIDRARLAFELWPDSSEAQARTNLRKLLHEIRANEIDPPLLDAGSSHVSLADDVAVDVLEVRTRSSAATARTWPAPTRAT